MPCYHPIPGWWSKARNESGKRSIVFSLDEGFKDKPAQVPCGKCVGCRLEQARQWAARCAHEASLYERNCFITLTYETEPEGGSLVPKHFVDFMKRLRWRCGEGIRFFHCGEYGAKRARPHHHSLLFNWDFDDKRWFSGKGDEVLYTSELLSELWGHGFATVGACTFASAGYVARYTLKKSGNPADYQGKVPEYLTMSRRPGIGRGWIEKYLTDCYPSDEMVVNGHITKPPRYYDDVAEKVMPEVVREIKFQRMVEGKRSPDSKGRQLVVREVVKKAAMTALRRPLEDV